MKSRVVMVGFGNSKSGFGRVTTTLARTLRQFYHVIQYHLDGRKAERSCAQGISRANESMFDPLGIAGLRELIIEERPAAVWMLNDFWWLRRYIDLLRLHRRDTKFIAYIPLDGVIARSGALASLEHFDAVVTYTDFARGEILRSVSALEWKGTPPSLPDIKVIPHGVDVESFYPQSPEGEKVSKLRRTLVGAEDNGSFLVLNGNQNNARKRLDITLGAFRDFSKDKPPGVKLILTGKIEASSGRMPGFRLRKLVERYALKERVILMGSDDHHSSMPDDELNLLFNACDVGINTSWGEGWGLVSCEHGATRTAQIVCNHTAGGEIWKENAYMLEAHQLCNNPAAVLRGFVPRERDVTLALEHLYQDDKLRAVLADKAHRHMNKPCYNWSNIGEQWREVFDSLI